VLTNKLKGYCNCNDYACSGGIFCYRLITSFFDFSLKKAVDIINSLDASKFPLLLNRITQAMQTGTNNEKAFSVEEEEKLQVSLGLQQSDLKLLLESTTFIIEQVSAHNVVLAYL
jgi:hypothetical protein